jgi:hypothetical protein
MGRPYVTGVTFNGGKIVLTVLLDTFLANKPVEISGFATQNSGGFATFYAIQSADENLDNTVLMYVTATPSVAFKQGEDVTVTLRASSVWVTVLGESQNGEIQPLKGSEPGGEGTPVLDGATWTNLKSVGYPAGWESAGNDPTFRGP